MPETRLSQPVASQFGEQTCHQLPSAVAVVQQKSATISEIHVTPVEHTTY